jgi:hypothetical protein
MDDIISQQQCAAWYSDRLSGAQLVRFMWAFKRSNNSVNYPLNDDEKSRIMVRFSLPLDYQPITNPPQAAYADTVGVVGTRFEPLEWLLGEILRGYWDPTRLENTPVWSTCHFALPI